MEMDWDLPDSELARRRGYGRERMRQKRLEAGVGPALFKGVPRHFLPFAIWLRDARGLLESMPSVGVADVLRMCPEEFRPLFPRCSVPYKSEVRSRRNRYIESLLVRLGLRIKRKSGFRMMHESVLSQANWDLPNILLSEIYRVHLQTVNRKRKMSGWPAKWDFRRRNNWTEEQRVQLGLLVEEERKRAELYWNERRSNEAVLLGQARA